VPCFVMGSRGLSRRARRTISDDDVIWLDVEEPGVLSMAKVFAWWRTATVGADVFTHVAKVDDDTFINVPNLLSALAAAASAPHLCLGAFAHAGYRPDTFRMCGWSWGAGTGSWRRLKCDKRGFSEPFPFPLGALQILSSPLARAIGGSSEVRAFAVAANESESLRTRDSNEDVALGYWIRRVASRAGFNVTFSPVNGRAPNLGCFRDAGLYRNPRPDAVFIHRIKGGAGMGYVWRVVHDGQPHDPINCARDAAIELPKNALVFTPSFERRVRAGEVEVSFSQKTNKITMSFKRPKSAEKIFGGGG
jgi:hypothetical protein